MLEIRWIIRPPDEMPEQCDAASPSGSMLCILKKGHDYRGPDSGGIGWEQHVSFARNGTLRSWS